jgi:hypothetical protein
MHNPAPTDLAEVLSPDWLTAVLREHHPNVEVGAVTVTETLKTTATKVRFVVDYRGTAPPDVPRAFCVKGFFGADSARWLALGASETEARFYRDLAPALSLRMPPCTYAAIDSSNRHGIVLMEDLVAAGARFLSALEPYSVQQAAASLDLLARLNASHWDGRGLDALSWLRPQLQQLGDSPVVSPEKLQSLLEGPRGAALPAEIKDGERIYRALRALHERSGAERICVVHGDAHAGNVFETASGPGLIDWQLLQRGCWALDVAYHIAAVLTVEDRERSERRLLAHYLDRLTAHGAEPPQWDDAWLHYRLAMIYGYYLWGITQRVAEEVTVEFVRRLGSAAAAHDSFRLLGV